MDAIRELLESYGDNDGWYNPRRILPWYDETGIFFIVGERRIGKTQLFVRLACDLWQHHGLKTFWIRDFDKQMQDPQFHSSFLTDALRMGWCPETWECDEEGVHDGDEIIIRFKGLNTFSNARGGSWPDVALIVQDEMMPEDGRYPKGCATGLMSLSKTILNGREDARIFCLSNYTSPVNPYFKKFKVISEHDSGVTAYPDKGVLIEVCAQGDYRSSIAKGGLWDKVYRAGSYGDYASAEEYSLTKLIRKRPKGNAQAVPYCIMEDGDLYRAWLVDGLFYWGRFTEAPKNTDVFTSEISETDTNVKLMPKWLVKQLKEASDLGAFRFEDANVMLAILGLFYDV